MVNMDDVIKESKSSRVKYVSFGEMVSKMLVRENEGKDFINCRLLVSKIGKEMGLKKVKVGDSGKEEFVYGDFREIWKVCLGKISKLDWF